MKLLTQINNQKGYICFTLMFLDEDYLDLDIDITKKFDKFIDGKRVCKTIYRKNIKTENISEATKEIISDLENILSEIYQ